MFNVNVPKKKLKIEHEGSINDQSAVSNGAYCAGWHLLSSVVL